MGHCGPLRGFNTQYFRKKMTEPFYPFLFWWVSALSDGQCFLICSVPVRTDGLHHPLWLVGVCVCTVLKNCLKSCFGFYKLNKTKKKRRRRVSNNKCQHIYTEQWSNGLKNKLKVYWQLTHLPPSYNSHHTVTQSQAGYICKSFKAEFKLCLK